MHCTPRSILAMLPLLAGCAHSSESLLLSIRHPVEDPTESWGILAGLDCTRTTYRYRGPPAVLFVWVEVKRDGELVDTPVQGRPVDPSGRLRELADVPASGLIDFSYQPPEQWPEQSYVRVAVDWNSQWHSWLNLPIPRGVLVTQGPDRISSDLDRLGKTATLVKAAFSVPDPPVNRAPRATPVRVQPPAAGRATIELALKLRAEPLPTDTRTALGPGLSFARRSREMPVE